VTLVLLFLLAFVGPYLTNWSYTDHDFEAFLQGPSVDHWFGTTQTGGDVYALTLRGMQKSLVIGLLVAMFSTGLAALVGSFAGYLGGWVDRVLMWFVDLLLVLPSFLIIAILSPTFRGKTWLVFVVLLAAFLWMVTARIVRGMTISLREREYVLAARYMGVPSHRIIFRHILPNISSLLIVDATINVSAAGHPDRRRHAVGDDVPVAVRLRGRPPRRARPRRQPRRRRAARRARPHLGAVGAKRWQSPSSPFVTCRSRSAGSPATSAPSAASTTSCAAARCSGSSASPGLASRPRRPQSRACCPGTRWSRAR
jgi:ABC-type spermidine/putrescine transport system permease subunit II